MFNVLHWFVHYTLYIEVEKLCKMWTKSFPSEKGHQKRKDAGEAQGARQGCRKYQIGWHQTKSGGQVWFHKTVKNPAYAYIHLYIYMAFFTKSLAGSHLFCLQIKASSHFLSAAILDWTFAQAKKWPPIFFLIGWQQDTTDASFLQPWCQVTGEL